jgi:hypothetical protein
MSNVVELCPGLTVIFFTVFEYQKKSNMVEPRRTGRGNYADRKTAIEQKEKLEGALPDRWRRNDEGRFDTNKPHFETKWFLVQQRRFEIL